jgi:hypothetical protein
LKKVDLMGGKETFAEKTKRLRGASPFGALPGWRIDGLIAKSNDDLRQVCATLPLSSLPVPFFHDVLNDLDPSP